MKDPEQTIEKLLKANAATVTAFERFEVGAGIEKKQEDFVAEVMAQIKASTQNPRPPRTRTVRKTQVTDQSPEKTPPASGVFFIIGAATARSGRGIHGAQEP